MTGFRDSVRVWPTNVLSPVELAGGAGRTLLAWRASGAVVARWLVAACEGWRQYTRLKYQLGIQTHP